MKKTARDLRGKLGKESAPVICGTDFSGAADDACWVAANLAKRMREPLVILHVHNPAQDWLSSGENEIRARLLDRLQRAAELYRKDIGLTVYPTLLFGLPDEKLCEFSVLSKAKLIVLSALGERPATKWLLGSVAERVAQESSVPLMVVRSSAPFEAAFHGKVLKIVAATDFSLASDVALDWLKNLRQVMETNVVAVHIATTDATPGHEELLTKRLRAYFKRPPKVLVVGEPESPAEAVLKVAKKEDAGLVLTGTHQRAGFDRFWNGSVSERILHDRSRNLLIIPHRRGRPAPAMR